MKKRVLIVTYYWPPSGGAGVQRWVKFTKYLPEFGVDPIVLTVKNPTYPIKDPSLEFDIPNETLVYKSKTIEPFSFYAGLSGKKAEHIKPTVELTGKSLKSKLGSWIRANIFVPDARIGWLLTACKKARKIVEEHAIDTVITTGPPHSVHFVGKSVKKKTGVRWIADFRDPWSQIYYNQVLPRTKLASYIDRKLEETILQKADEIVVVTPTQSKQFKSIVERKYHVVTNGFDPKDFENLSISLPKPPPIIIRHVGSVSETSIPDTFLNVITELKTKVNLKVEFIGSVHKSLSKKIKENNLSETIHIIDYLPHRKALKTMCEAHLLLLIIPDVEQISHHIPGKLFEYLGTQRPILCLGDPKGDAAKIIEEMNQGITFTHSDSSGIKKFIENFSTTNTESDKGFDYQHPDQKHPYSRITLTQQLAKLIT